MQFFKGIDTFTENANYTKNIFDKPLTKDAKAKKPELEVSKYQVMRSTQTTPQQKDMKLERKNRTFCESIIFTG